LRRDPHHRVLGGVAAGISKTYGIDLALVRVLWIVAGIAWVGVPAYIVAWIAIPKERDGENDDRDIPRDFGMLVALGLIGIGVLVAVHQIFPGAWHAGRIGGPLLLIAAGVAILIIRRPPDELPEEAPEVAPVDTPLQETIVEEAVVPSPEPPASAWTQTETWPAPPTRDERRAERRHYRRKRPRPFLTPITIAILFIGAGVTGLVQASGAVDVNLTVALAIATAFVGGVMVLSTWFGRAHGLIAVGVILSLLTAAASVVDIPLSGGFGNPMYRPRNVSELKTHYELAGGVLHLDFNELGGFEPGVTYTVNANVGAGELHVNVPSGTVIHASVKAGAIDMLGTKTGGWHITSSGEWLNGQPQQLILNLHVGAGRIWVNT
jgi:phage shock protein PspC (stress-responsive transcriptional regulator)